MGGTDKWVIDTSWSGFESRAVQYRFNRYMSPFGTCICFQSLQSTGRYYKSGMSVPYLAISYPESTGFLVSGRAPVETLGALTICTENPVIPGRIQMERFIPVECFPKKGNTFRGIPFSRFFRNCRKFLYHLSTITSARLFPRRQQCPWRRI